MGAAGDVDLAWLAGVRRVAIAVDASAPPHAVEDLVRSLRGLGPPHAGLPAVAREDLSATLPRRSSPT